MDKRQRHRCRAATYLEDLLTFDIGWCQLKVLWLRLADAKGVEQAAVRAPGVEAGIEVVLGAESEGLGILCGPVLELRGLRCPISKIANRRPVGDTGVVRWGIGRDRHARSVRNAGLMVERRGLEPRTFCMPCRCSPN